jgi:ATP-binding cassette subfamily B protein
MTTSPSDYLSRVFPRRFLLRGAALQSLVATAFGTLGLAVLLQLALLLLVLIETGGRIDLLDGQASEFYSLTGDPAADLPEIPEPGWDAAPADGGLRAVVWKLRDRPIAGAVAWCSRLSPPLLHSTTTAFLTLLVAGFLFTLVVFGCYEYASRAADAAATRTGHQLRESLHRHSLRMGTSDLTDRQVPEVLELFTTDIEAVRRWIVAFVSQSVRTVLQLATLLVIGALIDWSFLVECGIPVLACWLFVIRYLRRNRRERRLEEDRAATELKLASEGIYRSRLIRGFLLDAFEQIRFQRHLVRYESHVTAVGRLKRWQFLVASFSILVALSIVAYVAGGRVLANAADSLSHSEVAFLCGVLVLQAGPLCGLARLMDERTAARTSIDRIYRYLNAIPEVGQAVGAEFLQPLEKTIEYCDVTYRAHGKRVLDGISLKIPAEGTTAIVAFDRTEAVALASMLPRFIDPAQGKLTIDGHDLALATLESLRSEVVWTGGPGSWFTGSVVENIAGGDQRFSLSQVAEAAKRVHAHNFIQKFPQGYETVVGEHGEQLSESQGFRVSLARALLRDPAVIIVEEPSDVDSPDEKTLLEDACRNVASGRTVIVLPARLRSLKNADRIVLLNRGRIEVVGTHEALLKTSSLYRHWEYLHFNEFRRDVSPTA